MLCRVRPLLNHEYKGKKESSSIKLINDHKISVTNDYKSKYMTFAFDKVFKESES